MRLKPIKSRSLAFEIAAMLRRLTGDVIAVFPAYSARTGQIMGWKVLRAEPGGKEMNA